MFEDKLIYYGNYSLKLALEKGAVFQKRTGKHKQFVFWNGDTVVKGPYDKEAIEKIYFRSKEFKKYKCLNVIHPIGYYTLIDPVDIKINSKKIYFIIYPNISKNKCLTMFKHTESFSNLTLNVIERTEVVKLNNVIEEEWIKSYIPNLLYTLICLRVLKVGDMCLSNIIVNIETKNVVVIDYDYSKEIDRNSEDFYFCKSPAKNKLAYWLSQVRPHYNTTLDKLKEFIEEPRVLHIYNMLQNIMNSIENEKHMLSNTIQLIGNININDNKQVNMSNSNLGKMRYVGPMAVNISYNGFETDVLKSGVQKYIRRNNYEKAIMCAFELYKFHEVPDGRRIQSNMYNRLAIIACEDIGPANISLVVNCIRIVKEDKRNPNELISLIYLMCKSEKTRCGSWYNSVHNTPTGRNLAKTIGLQVDDFVDMELVKMINLNIWKEGDPIDIMNFANMFYVRLCQRNVLCFTWLSLYEQNIKDKKVVPRNRRTDPMVIIWLYLKSFMNVNVYETLFWAFFNFRERNLFLMTAILTVLYNIEYTQTNITNINYDIEKMLKCEYKLTIDDYVVDMHTRSGSYKGMNRENFIKEGSYVTPEANLFKNEVYEYIYANHI